MRLVRASPPPAAWHASTPDALGLESLALRQAAYGFAVAALTSTQKTMQPIITNALKCTKGVWQLIMDSTCATVRRDPASGLLGGIPFLAAGTSFQSATVAAHATVASMAMPKAQRASSRLLAAAASLMPTMDAVDEADSGRLAKGGDARRAPGASLFSYASLAAEGGVEAADVVGGTLSEGADSEHADTGTVAAMDDADTEGGVDGDTSPVVIEVDFWTSMPSFAAALRAIDRLAAGFPDDPAGAAEILLAFDAGGSPSGAAEPLDATACLPVRLFIVKLLLSRPAFFRSQAHAWTPRLLACMLALHAFSVASIAEGGRPCMPAAFSEPQVAGELVRPLFVDHPPYPPPTTQRSTTSSVTCACC